MNILTLILLLFFTSSVTAVEYIWDCSKAFTDCGKSADTSNSAYHAPGTIWENMSCEQGEPPYNKGYVFLKQSGRAIRNYECKPIRQDEVCKNGTPVDGYWGKNASMGGSYCDGTCLVTPDSESPVDGSSPSGVSSGVSVSGKKSGALCSNPKPENMPIPGFTPKSECDTEGKVWITQMCIVTGCTCWNACDEEVDCGPENPNPECSEGSYSYGGVCMENPYGGSGGGASPTNPGGNPANPANPAGGSGSDPANPANPANPTNPTGGSGSDPANPANPTNPTGGTGGSAPANPANPTNPTGGTGTGTGGTGTGTGGTGTGTGGTGTGTGGTGTGTGGTGTGTGGTGTGTGGTGTGTGDGNGSGTGNAQFSCGPLPAEVCQLLSGQSNSDKNDDSEPQNYNVVQKLDEKLDKAIKDQQETPVKSWWDFAGGFEKVDMNDVYNKLIAPFKLTPSGSCPISGFKPSFTIAGRTISLDLGLSEAQICKYLELLAIMFRLMFLLLAFRLIIRAITGV